MRILQIIPAYYPAVSWGGPIVSVRLLNKELVKLGNEVIVITTTFGLEKNETQENVIDGVKVLYLKSFKFFRWLIPYRLRFALSDWLNGIDIVHIHQIWDPICWLSELFLIKKKKHGKNEQDSLLPAKKSKIFLPFVIAPRGSIDPVLIKKKSYFLKKIIYALFIKRIFKKAGGFHFTSEYERNKFLEFTRINTDYNTDKHRLNPHKTALCRIIFNPLDLSEFEKEPNKNLLQKWNLLYPHESVSSPRQSVFVKRYFLYLGRINWKKGLEILIGAFLKFINDNQNSNPRESASSQRESAYRLVIAGPDENNYKLKIEKLAKEKGIEKKVIFTGLVKGDDKLVLLKNAEAFILPSLGENFGIAVAEAMAVGTPVIISKYVGLQNIVEKYKAGIVIDLDEKVLSQKMREITENTDLKNKIIANGQKLVQEQFQPAAIAKQIIEFYKQL
jgi:glycosyltransferase involved in cell wall biosynthesis